MLILFVNSIVTKSSNWNLFSVRSLSGKNDNKNDGDIETSNKLTKVNQKKESFRLENASKKLETLSMNAKEFQSISPKNSKSVSKIISKPKYFVRASARSKEEKDNAIPVETIEPLKEYVHVCFVLICFLIFSNLIEWLADLIKD